MFCKECGVENSDESLFCKECGTGLKENAGENKEKVENKLDKKELKYNIKPQYNYGYKLITVGLTSILVVLFLIFYFFEEYTAYIITEYSFIVLAVMLVYVGGRLLFEKLQYNKLNYNFYNDRVEYVDGFLNISQKELKYKYIRETTMTQNILERIFGIGTIKIFTNASSGMGKWGARYNNNNTNMMNGITIHCINNVKEQYDKIKELVDEATSSDDE